MGATHRPYKMEPRHRLAARGSNPTPRAADSLDLGMLYRNLTAEHPVHLRPGDLPL
ncbi:hypothetical protein [Nocardia neocaledoniensis]|uniref:hypothetical protein n=1 Tax=Nocardia neocaledoniensis TaxID=236511 RepID=UPI002458B3DC|nr:hypothetical protein [Nocardia neocaledoniensis]